MIEGKTILCFASNYEAPPTSKHHVMHILAERNVVLWINYHASRAPSASSSDVLYIVHKLKQVAGGLKNPRRNFHVLTPLVIPLPSSATARRLNRLLLITQVRMALAGVQRGPTQLWSFTPDVAYALGHFKEVRVVYYCVDDHASFSGYNKSQVLQDEEALCRRSDLVVTTSKTLQEAKAPWNPNTILVPHGVDYDHFSRAVRENLPCPQDLEAIPRPRLGFIGLIRDWVDLGLIAHVAEMHPEWHFVWIGDADSSVNTAQYRKMPNMHFLGRRPYEALPAYCRHFDVGLIPFKINALTRAVNPIKLREYLAAGLPVISTSMPEVAQYRGLIQIADSPEEFDYAVKECLETSSAYASARVEAMAGETWPQKVTLISERLGSLPKA
ncbi:MAG: glycosyltransferase [Desulfobacteraceae bacterium]|jgi:glycosyltransferase involved in cell wall biosynthesis